MKPRPGELLYCQKTPDDIRKRGFTGCGLPVKGCVYTLKSTVPGNTGVDLYVLEEVSSRAQGPNGDILLIAWRPENFRVCRVPDVPTMLSKIMSVMTTKDMNGYVREYEEMRKEADKHRRARY